GAADADVIVLLHEDQTARVLTPAQCEVSPVQSIDPTRSAARVSAAASAGEELDGDVAGGVDRALVAISSELVGVCDRALEMTVAYVKERRQFGVPVGAYQAVSHRCAQMLLETESARSTAAFAAWTADADPEQLAEAAAMAKASASDAGREVTASAIQAHGGIGFTWEADVRRYYAESRSAFPDQRNEVVALHHADDAVVVEFVLLGTHLGPLRGLPPTGRSFRCRMTALFVFEDDRLVGERVYFDQATI